MKKIFFSIFIFVVSMFVVACSSSESSDNMDTIDTINTQENSVERVNWFSEGLDAISEQSKVYGKIRVAYSFFTIDNEPYVEFFYGHNINALITHEDIYNSFENVIYDVSLADRSGNIIQSLNQENWNNFNDFENLFTIHQWSNEIPDGGYTIEFHKSVIYKIDTDTLTINSGKIYFHIFAPEANFINGAGCTLYFKYKDGGIVFGDSNIFNDEPGGTFSAYYFYE